MIKSRTRLAQVAALAAAGALLLSGCVQSGRTSNPDSVQEDDSSECPVEVNNDIDATVNIAYQPIPNGDLVVRDRGWLENCMPNANIVWNEYPSGGAVVQAFGSNSADIGLVGSSPATKSLSPTISDDLKIVWIFDVIGDAESLVVHDGVDAKKLTDLKGKKVAVPFASTAHYSLLAALKRNHMTTADIQLINLSPDAMLAAWQRKEIDAAWVWAPTLPLLTKTGTIILSAAATAKAGAPTFDLAAATTKFVKANPEFMTMWTALQSEAVKEIQDDPDKAAESIAVQLGLDADQVKDQLTGYTYLTAKEQAAPDYFGGKLGKDLVNTADFLVTQGEIKEANPPQFYKDAIYPDAINKVAK